MIVFRVEHPKYENPNAPDVRVGPYVTSSVGWDDVEVHDISNELDWAHRSVLTHPSPRWDGLRDRHSFEVCGFSNVAQAAVWFRGFRRRMAGAGYKIGVYRVPKRWVRFGDKQVLFDSRRAKRIEHVSLIRIPNRWRSA